MNVGTADFSFERGNARVGARKSRVEVGDVRHDGIPMRGRQDRPRSDGRTHVGRKRGVERKVSCYQESDWNEDFRNRRLHTGSNEGIIFGGNPTI